MSVCATMWAWKLSKEQVTSTEKYILLSMADRANENHECWPSKERLSKDTLLDRKTIFSAILSLENKGIITKTGRKAGKLKRTDIYRLNGVKGREDEENSNRTENGTTKDCTISNRTENGTVNRTENGIYRNLSVEPITKTYCNRDEAALSCSDEQEQTLPPPKKKPKAVKTSLPVDEFVDEWNSVCALPEASCIPVKKGKTEVVNLITKRLNAMAIHWPEINSEEDFRLAKETPLTPVNFRVFLEGLIKAKWFMLCGDTPHSMEVILREKNFENGIRTIKQRQKDKA